MTWGDIISLFFVLVLNPYGVVFTAIFLLMAISAFISLGVEVITMPYRWVVKTFYCPFRKANVEAKLQPSTSTYRAYDDVITCSAFKGKVTCKKKCLDLPELQT